MIRIERHTPPATNGSRSFAEIVIDRPDKRNALTEAMLAEMLAALRTLADEPEHGALVLRGEGRFFCAGFDMQACLEQPERLGGMLTELSKVVRALRRFSTPVVVAVQGGAVAGGCALVCGADLVVADPSAKFGYPVVKLGVSPAVSAPALLLALPEGAARSLLLDPELITGEEARRRGLVGLLVNSPEDAVPRAQVEAMRLSAKPRDAVRRTKAWLNEVEGSTDDGAMAEALAASMALVGSEEQVRLVAAAFGA
ncbi:MAG: enoyl-CoA hydratase/isomerase family protein [Phycisphaerales bacterium]